MIEKMGGTMADPEPERSPDPALAEKAVPKVNLTEERQLWFQYLGRLKDRAASSQKASGLSTWAIGGTVAFLAFRLIERIPIFTAEPRSLGLHVMTLAAICSILASFGLILMALECKTLRPRETRLQTPGDRDFAPPALIPLWLSIILYGTASYFIAAEAAEQRGLSGWPFKVHGLLFGILAICALIVHALDVMAGKDDELEGLRMPRMPWVERLILAVGTASLAVALYSTAQALPHVKSALHVDVIIWAIQAAGFVALLLLLWGRAFATHASACIDDLEERLILENLSADTVRECYIREVLGQSLRACVKSHCNGGK
jgi:MFS family permease